MKRLMQKLSRLRRKLFASWQPVDVTSPNLIQLITDAMAVGGQIQIEYQGSGWRLIQPYGWNSSQMGNVLLMCYKETGEIRSYRLDRIQQVLVDDSLLQNQIDTLHNDDMYQVQDYGEQERANPEDFEIPLLPNMDEVLYQSENEMGEKLPYDEALDVLTDQIPPDMPEEQPLDGEEELPPEPDTNDENNQVEQPEDTNDSEEEKLNGK